MKKLFISITLIIAGIFFNSKAIPPEKFKARFSKEIKDLKMSKSLIELLCPLLKDTHLINLKEILPVVKNIPQEERKEVLKSASLLTHTCAKTSDYITIIEAVSQLPHGQREEVVKSSKPYLDINRNNYRRLADGELFKLLKGVAALPQDQKESIQKHAAKFTSGHSSIDHIVDVLEALRKIPSLEDREEVVTSTHYLFQKTQIKNSPAEILGMVFDLPHGQRMDVIKRSCTLLNMSHFPKEDDVRKILQVMINVPADQQEEIVINTKHFAPSNPLRAHDLAKILQAVAQLPPGQQEEVFINTKHLAPDRLRAKDLAKILEAVAHTSHGQREEITLCTKHLAPESLRPEDLVTMIEAVAQLPPGQRKEIVKSAKPYITKHILNAPSGKGGLMLSDGNLIKRLLRTVATFPQVQRDWILQKYAVKFTNDHSSIDHIVDALEEIPLENRKEVVDGMIYFSQQVRIQNSFRKIIEVVSEIPAGQRIGVITNAFPLINLRDSPNLDDVRKILHVMTHVPAPHREEVMISAKHLAPDRLQTEDLVTIIEAVEQLPQGQREEIVKSSKPYLDMNWNNRRRLPKGELLKLLKGVAALPQDQRESIQKHAAKFTDCDSSIDHIVDILEGLGKIPLGVREEIVTGTHNLFGKVDTRRTKTESFREILEMVSEIPAEQRMDVIKSSYALLKMYYIPKVDDARKAIRAMIDVPAAQHEKVVIGIRQLFPKIFRRTEEENPLREIIELVSKAPAEQRGDFIESSYTLLKMFSSPIVSDARKAIRSMIDVPAPQHKKVVAGILNLFQKIEPRLTKADSYRETLEMVSEIPAEQRMDVITTSFPFINLYQCPKHDDVREIMKTMSRIPAGQREEVVTGIRHLLQKIDPYQSEIEKSFKEILEVVSDIPTEQWMEVITSSCSFIDLYHFPKLDDVREIMKTMSRIPAGQRQEIGISTKLISSNSLFCIKDIIKILEAAIQLPPDQRVEIIESSSPLINSCGHRRFVDVKKIIQEMSGIPALQRMDLSTSYTLLFSHKTGLDTDEALNNLREIREISESLGSHLFRSIIQSSDTVGGRAEVFYLLKSVIDVPLRSNLIEIFIEDPNRVNQFRRTVRGLRNTNGAHMAFTREVVQQYIQMQAALREGEKIDAERFDWLTTWARDYVTQGRAVQRPQNFTNEPANEIHNAVKMPVTYKGRPEPAHKVVEHLLIIDLKSRKMRLRNCLDEMKSIPDLDLDRVTTVLSHAYYAPDEQEELTDMITPLLGYVWPYMKQRPIETQRAWLTLVTNESLEAYDGRPGTLSCPRGIQERLTVTGFLPLLEDVDPRLIGITSLASSLATDAFGVLQNGFNNLSKDEYQRILELDVLTPGKVQDLFDKALEGYATQNKYFHVEGLDLVHDFVNNAFLKTRVAEFLELYASPDYGKLAELKALARQKLSKPEEPDEVGRF